MPEVYVTLFDSVFLPQGLALYRSLLNHAGDFRLWVLCLDSPCHSFLQNLQLEHIFLLNLADLENTQLLDVKANRSHAEYCWTLTPWAIQWVFEADLAAHRVTYLDADTFFLKSPKRIFHEFQLSRKSFMITEHGYSPNCDQSFTSGRFCVQFVPVVRHKGEIVLYWWRDRCLEWCFDRFENGLFGDQKYFEIISDLFFDSVFILKGDGRFLAPWNASYFRYSDAVVYHFHGLRILSPDRFILTSYKLPRPVLSYVYKPYTSSLRQICFDYQDLLPSLKPQVALTFKIKLALLFGTLYRFFNHSFSRLPFLLSFVFD